MEQELEQIISSIRLKLRAKSPFFATLFLFTNCKYNSDIPTAATDGKEIYLNPEFFLSLSTSEREGVIMHELLHAALLHPVRSGTRNKEIWNIAADIAVNLIIKNEQHLTLPEGAIFPPSNWQELGLKHQPEWEKLSVEEIYELLSKIAENPQKQLNWSDKLADLSPDAILNGNNGNNDDNNQQNSSEDKPHPNPPLSKGREPIFPPLTKGGLGGVNSTLNSDNSDNNQQNSSGVDNQISPEKLRTYWEKAMQQAVVIARTSSQGKLPTGIERQIAEISEAQLDWRCYLWRYLVQTPTDFQGCDRRFIWQGLYLETLIGESVQVFVAIDTSGSIDNEEMKMFLGEVLGILNAYPHIKCYLYYADANIYGPYDINKHDEIPKPKGGGGTSFIPFFEEVETERNFDKQGVCVYLTDGYGNFPQNPPSLPVLWVVTPGGLDLKQFPFGEAVRLLSV